VADGYLLSKHAIERIVSRLDRLDLDHSNLRRRVESRQSPAVFNDPRRKKFKNNSGEEVPAYAVMEVSAGAQGPFTHELLTIVKPTTTFRRLYLVNGPEPVAADGQGWGRYLMDDSSDNLVLYETGNTPAIGESWGAKASQWSLAKNRPGFLITAANNTSATNPYTSAVQYIVNELIGKSDADISKGSSGTISIWMGTPGSETDTTMNVTAYANGVAIEGTTAKWVSLKWTNGAWYVGCWES
jgi:hypothetical protein